ncbi:MAG: Flp pilus assembly protein CpaB [Bauldia sp.]|nr:Flp pilus assembly protein CpaB [Bauldia sp.]
MNVARILVLVIALAAGGAAAYLAMNLINREPETITVIAAAEPVVPIATEEVLVARESIALGTTLERDHFRWQEWPAETVGRGYITRTDQPDAISEFSSTVARSSFLAGEPITPEKLARTDGGLLSALLPAGFRAVATSISAETSAGGFILPNDRVDILMTRNLERGTVTEVILNNVRVLAIDQQIRDQDGEQVVVGNTATLELTAQQTEILAVAQRLANRDDGRLTLALRSLEDADEVLPEGQGDAVHLIEGENTPGGGMTVIRNGVVTQVSPGQ